MCAGGTQSGKNSKRVHSSSTHYIEPNFDHGLLTKQGGKGSTSKEQGQRHIQHTHTHFPHTSNGIKTNRRARITRPWCSWCGCRTRSKPTRSTASNNRRYWCRTRWSGCGFRRPQTQPERTARDRRKLQQTARPRHQPAYGVLWRYRQSGIGKEIFTYQRHHHCWDLVTMSSKTASNIGPCYHASINEKHPLPLPFFYL